LGEWLEDVDKAEAGSEMERKDGVLIGTVREAKVDNGGKLSNSSY